MRSEVLLQWQMRILEEHLSAEADYLLASEVSSAGCVVLSERDLANEEDKRNTIAHLNHALAGIGCKRVLEGDEILEKTTDSMTDADFERIMAVGYKQASYRKMDATEEDFTSLYFLELHKNVQELVKLPDRFWQIRHADMFSASKDLQKKTVGNRLMQRETIC